MLGAKHIAVIMDGNRRWATSNGMSILKGHSAGVNSLKAMVKVAPDLGVKYLTAYAFSTENWKRSAPEREVIFRLLKEVSIKELEELASKNVRVSYIGDIEAFSDDIKEALRQLENKTKDNDGLFLQIALNYGSIAEITNAMSKITGELDTDAIKNLSPEVFSDYLYTKDIPDPDIMIRTGGDQRLSNYLLWQSSKAFLKFTDTLWPDFSAEELAETLKEFEAKELAV